MPTIKILIIFIITGSLVEGRYDGQQRHLNKLLNIISNNRPIETIIMIWHHGDEDCTLQHWNLNEIPFLRSNEIGEIRSVRETFNKQALAIVCLTGNYHYDSQLLDVAAGAFETMRQERILLWSQRKLTKKFLQWISIQAGKHKFMRMLVLEIGSLPSAISLHRLEAFPSPHLTRIRNISSFKELGFYRRKYNFQGRNIFVKPSTDEEGNAPASLYPITRLEDLEIIEFAKKYNGSLKVLNGSHTDDACDIQLSPQIIAMGNVSTQMDFVNPLSAASLMVIVPCSSELSVEDVLRRLGVLTWMWYLLSVYCTFVLVETIILVVTHRITGEPRRLTLWNPLMNLRAFRAILGLPFPELRQASLSLRQLFLAITLFGFIFSNFFNCKLSALLSTPVKRAQVRNFEELRDSGMITVTNDYVRSYIESEIDPEFFRRVIPTFITAGHLERVKLFTSLNKKYSFILLSTNWLYYDQFQRALGHKIYCESPDLIITENLPWVYVMPNNSFYNWPLSRYLMSVHESGLATFWIKSIIKRLVKAFKVKVPPNKSSEATPISLEHLNWLWRLLIMGYVIATLVFIIEISLRKRNNCRTRTGNAAEV